MTRDASSSASGSQRARSADSSGGRYLLCDVRLLPGPAGVGALGAALLLLWLAAHQLVHSFVGSTLLAPALCDGRPWAVVTAAVLSAPAFALAVAWADRTRIYWNPDELQLVVERFRLSSIARFRVSTGEIAMMRVKRRPRGLCSAWDVGYRDFAGGSMQIVRLRAREEAVRVGERIASAVSRPITVTA